MKRWIIGLAAFALVAFGAIAIAQNRMEGQGGIWAIGSGGALNVEAGATQTIASGATLNLATGAVFQKAGVTQNSTNGVIALDGSNPTSVLPGLALITSCTASLKTPTAPNLSTSVVTVNFSTQQLDLWAWKPTSGASPNLTASTGTENVAWICFGT